MFHVSCLTVPTNISNLFIKANENIITRPGSLPPAIFILTDRDWIKTMVHLLSSELSFGTPFAMNFVNSLRELSKNMSVTCYFRYQRPKTIMLNRPFCFKKYITIEQIQSLIYQVSISQFSVAVNFTSFK